MSRTPRQTIGSRASHALVTSGWLLNVHETETPQDVEVFVLQSVWQGTGPNTPSKSPQGDRSLIRIRNWYFMFDALVIIESLETPVIHQRRERSEMVCDG